MGNNNATANLTEEESSKLESNGMSPLESVSLDNTQDQVFLGGEGKDGDKQNESSVPDGVIGEETPETEPESKELHEDPKVTKVEEEMSHNGLESLVVEADDQLKKITSAAEGVETVWEAAEVEELSMVGTQRVVRNLNTNETAGTEEKMVNESLEETATAGKLLKLDQEEICVEQRTQFPEIEPLEILNLDYRVLDDDDDDDEVTHEGKADQEISKPGSQGSNSILETSFEVYKEERDMTLGREANLKRMSRCRSLPVRHNSRVIGDSLVQQLVSEVTIPSRNNMGLDKANTSEILLVSCLKSNKEQATSEAITESSNEARLDIRSPSFSNDVRIEERSDKSTEEAPLLPQGKKVTVDVEEKAVMLKRSETDKTRGFELSLGLSMNLSGRCDADDSFKETKGSGDNLVDKIANTSETLLVSCGGSREAQGTTEVITESNKKALTEMRSPSFSNDVRIEEGSDKSMEEAPLLSQSQSKTKTYEVALDMDEKTVMLKRSETEKTRGFELSLGLSMNLSGRSDADYSFKETKGSGINLEDKKANTSDTPLVSCVGSSEAQGTTEVITESNKKDLTEMRSPSFSNDVRIEEGSDKSMEEAPLLSQSKTKTYELALDMEEKTVMLKRSETEKTRGFELSLGLSMNLSGRCDADDIFKETKGSGDNLVDKIANTSETLLVSCVGSSEAQETSEVITQSNQKDLIEMRSPSFGNDLRTKERSDESTEHIPLLCQDKIETHEPTIDAEKKTVILKRSKSEKTRGFELSLGLSMNVSGRPNADGSLKEAKDLGDSLLDKKASWGPVKGRVRKRSKSSLFGTCLCCATAMN